MKGPYWEWGKEYKETLLAKLREFKEFNQKFWIKRKSSWWIRSEVLQ